jgi:hypothetical protein
MASFARYPSNRVGNDWTGKPWSPAVSDAEHDMHEELTRLRRENAELRVKAQSAEEQRDAFSVVARTLVLNPFADMDDLRRSARNALRMGR